MDSVVTILYARVRNVLPVCNALPPNLSAGFADELRGVLEAPVSRASGLVAQRRPDSILAVFGNRPDEQPDHARRAFQAAVDSVCELGALNQRIQRRVPQAPRLALATGVHVGEAEVAPSLRGTSGAVRATGEAVEVARVLECTAPDIGWSIVASSRARRAAGSRIEAGRFGSVALPDDSFIDIAEVTGLAARKSSKEAIVENQKLYERSQDLAGAATQAARNAALHFSIEGYRIARKIGEGGMASIYLAEGPAGELQVLKVMRILVGEHGDPLQRFIQEFALLAQATHPNVARIHRQGFCAGHAYIAMEYFAEGDLRHRIGRGLAPALALSYLKQTAAGLQAIHAAGIVHRDLKPDNLMLRKDGSLALADFGIAKHVSMSITDTAHDEVVGTPYYLSPEQASGRPVDQRCDLYSLGVIFYEMLTGDKPYRAPSAEALLDLHIAAPVPQLPPAHARLQPLLQRLMAKDCERRYASAGEVLAELPKFAK